MNLANVKELKRYLPAGGWSVVEMLITITAVSVVLMISAPGINSMVQKYHVNNTSDLLHSSLVTAQTESARRSSTVRVCPSSDGLNCRTDGDWNRGWVVFSDGNANFKPDTIEIIEVFGPPNKNINIFATGAFADRASFNRAGLVQENDASTGSFKVCYDAEDAEFSSSISSDETGIIEVRGSKQACLPT